MNKNRFPNDSTELARQVHELEDLLDGVSEGVLVVDADWGILFSNSGCDPFVHMSRQEAIGCPLWQAAPEWAGTDMEQELRNATALTVPHEFEAESPSVLGTILRIRVLPRPQGGARIFIADVTARREAERARGRTEQMLRDLADAMPVLISYIDAEETFVFANRTYESWFGRSLQAIVGHKAKEVLGNDFYAARKPYIERALQGEPVTYEVPFPQDGRPTTVRHIPSVDRGGRVVGIYTLVQDLSDLREAEERLADSQTRLEVATEASQLGIWEWRLDTDDFIMSARGRVIWGFDAIKPLCGADLDRAMHPEDIQAVHDQARRAFDPMLRDMQPYEYRVIRPDGAVRWVRAHGSVTFQLGPQGPVASRYIGTMEDVTDRRRIQEELVTAGARLRLAIEAGRMAVWSLDVRTGSVGVTPEFNRMVGLPANAQPTLEELQAQYYPGEQERLAQLALESLGKGQRYFEGEYRHIRADDGSLRWFLVRAEFQLGADGQPVDCIGVVLDITARKAEEERLALLAREVDHRANNLLTIVQSAIALTESDTVAGYRRALIGRIQALARAHQLLAASRWEGADLLRLVCEEFRPYIVPGAGRVQIRGKPVSLPPALAQGVALVLHELTTNALKHGGLSGPAGCVEVEWGEQADGECVILWREVGGPAAGVPTRRGMGLRLLGRALAGHGAVELDWRPEGLVCIIRLQLANVASTTIDPDAQVFQA